MHLNYSNLFNSNLVSQFGFNFRTFELCIDLILRYPFYCFVKYFNNFVVCSHIIFYCSKLTLYFCLINRRCLLWVYSALVSLHLLFPRRYFQQNSNFFAKSFISQCYSMRTFPNYCYLLTSINYYEFVNYPRLQSNPSYLFLKHFITLKNFNFWKLTAMCLHMCSF